MKRLLLVLAVFAVGAAACSTCADLDAPLGYVCEPGEADACAGTWRCHSLTHRCFDPDQAPTWTPAECASAKGSDDCPAQWLCATNAVDAPVGLCVDLVEPGATPCFADDACAVDAGWRCDQVVRRCAEVGDRVAARSADFEIALTSPQLTDPVPALVTAGPSYRGVDLPGLPSRPNGYSARLWATWSDAGVLSLFVNSEQQQLPDGGSYVLSGRRFTGVARPRGLTMLGDAVAVLDTAGQLKLYRLNGATQNVDVGYPATAIDGVANRTMLDPSVDAAQIVVAAEGRAPVLVNRDGSRAFVDGRGFDAGAVVDVAAQVLNGNHGAYLSQVGSVCLVSDTALSSGCTDTLPAPGLDDGGFGATYTPRHVHVAVAAGAWADLLVEVAPRNAPLQSRPTQALMLDVPLASPPENVEGPANVCPCGAPSDHLWMTRTMDPQYRQRRLFSRCPQVQCDGGTVPARTWELRLGRAGAPPAFELAPEDDRPYRTPFTPATRSPSVRGIAGEAGRFWVADELLPDTTGQYPLRPVLLDRPPLSIFRLDSKALQGVFALRETEAIPLVPGYGFVTQNQSAGKASLVLLGTVAGHPSWLVTERLVFDADFFPGGGEAPRQIVQLPAGAPNLVAPVEAAVLGDRVLLTSGDTIYSAQLPASEFDPPAELQATAVPAPGLAITSFAARLGQDGKAVAYALSVQGVVRLESDDLSQWRLFPVETIPGEGVPVRLWQDDAGALRLGYRSGLVTPVAFGAPLTRPAQGTTFRSYAQLCGQLLALSDADGLYQLTAGEAVPGWEKLPSAVLPPAIDWRQVRLYENRGVMYLANALGDVFELTATSGGQLLCP